MHEQRAVHEIRAFAMPDIPGEIRRPINTEPADVSLGDQSPLRDDAALPAEADHEINPSVAASDPGGSRSDREFHIRFPASGQHQIKKYEIFPGLVG